MDKALKEIREVERSGNNLTLLLVFDGYSGIFRINFINRLGETRKGSWEVNLQAMDVYHEVGASYEKYRTSTTHNIENMIYALIWLQIHKQYVIEECLRLNIL